MKKRCIKSGFSILEVIVAVSLLSIVLVSAVSYTTYLMRNMTYNQNKLYATRHLDDLKEFVDGERLSDWIAFAGKASSLGGNVYCFNGMIVATTTIPSTGTCTLFTGITSVPPQIFKRELNLKGGVDGVTATFTVSWQQDGKEYKEEAVSVYTQWQR